MAGAGVDGSRDQSTSTRLALIWVNRKRRRGWYILPDAGKTTLLTGWYRLLP